MRFVWTTTFFVSLCACVAACASSTAPGDGDADADVDADSDSDVDSDADSDGDTYPDPCEGVDCSGHGECVVVSPDTIRCVCDPGYDAVGLSCEPAAPDGDGDSDIDVDSDIDSDADSDADSDVECDWPCTVEDPTHPLLRLTSIQFLAPPALASPLLQAILDDTIDMFGFLWLVEFDLEDRTLTTGSGMGEGIPPTTDEEFCSVTWNPDYPPATGRIDDDIDIDTVEPLEHLEIPIYSEDSTGSPLILLPLSMVQLHDVLLDEECFMIGEPGDSAASWETDGTLEAWIGWDDAREVMVEDLGRTLCDLLCGELCTEVDRPTDCRNPADTIPGTDTFGYEMVAEIGAAPVGGY